MGEQKLVSERGTLFLTDDEVIEAFDWDGAAQALAAAYGSDATDAMFPPRTIARGEGVWMRTMTGIAPTGAVLGAKFIVASMAAGAASYLIPLFDQKTAELLALLDGNSVTGFRTAATTALAADRLAVPGPIRLATIGSGFEAKNHVRALAAVREITHVSVFSPNPDSRAGFIAALADLNIPMTSADSAEATLTDANVVLCAARSRDETPTLLGAWLRPGMTVLSIGSTVPEQREVDPETIARADLIVADMVEEVLHDTGDILVAAKEGIEAASKTVSLADLVSGRHAGRPDSDAIVVYKSVGAAIQDIAVAEYCVNRATELGIGTKLPVTISPVLKGKPGKKS